LISTRGSGFDGPRTSLNRTDSGHEILMSADTGPTTRPHQAAASNRDPGLSSADVATGVRSRDLAALQIVVHITFDLANASCVRYSRT